MSDHNQPELDPETPPWLQPVDADVVVDPGLSRGFKLKLAIGFGVLFIAVGAVAAVMYFNDTDDAAGAPTIRHVSAPQTPFKTKPANPGGMEVAHQDKEVLEAAAGSDSQPLAVSSPPEQPLDNLSDAVNMGSKPAKSAEKEQSQAIKSPASADSKKSIPKPADKAQEKAVASKLNQSSSNDEGWRVQLGAFATEDGAKRAWARAKSELGAMVANLRPEYIPVDAGDRQLVRLRAGSLYDRNSAAAVCLAARDKKLGCYVVPPGR